MVVETFEICISTMAGNALKLSTMLGENHADIGGSIITDRKSFYCRVASWNRHTR